MMDTDAVGLMTQTWKELNAPWNIWSLGIGVSWQLDLPGVSEEMWLSGIWTDVPFVVFLLGVK